MLTGTQGPSIPKQTPTTKSVDLHGCALASALIFLLLAPVSDAIINSDWGIMGLLLFPSSFNFLPCQVFAIPCAIFLFAAGIIVFFVERNNQSDARYAAKQQSKKSYETAMATYNRAVEQDRLRVERERPKKLLLQGQLKTLKDAHKKTVDTLNKLYNKGVIHKNIGSRSYLFLVRLLRYWRMHSAGRP